MQSEGQRTTETTIFVHTKNSEIRIFAYFLLNFYQNWSSIIEPESALRLGFWQTFFSGILQSLGASEKNSVDFRKNIFHAYFSCKSAIARDSDFEVKTAFWRELRANFRNVSEW